MSTVEILLLVLIIFLSLLVLVLTILLTKNNKKDDLKDVRISINKDFLNLSNKLNNDLANLGNITSDRLINLEEKLNKNIVDTNKATNEVFNRINERMVKIDESQKALNSLSDDIFKLQSILNDKKSRGTFGEIELYSLLENTFGLNDNFYRKQYSLSNGLRADAAIFGPESMGVVCIDSKFPLENYQRMYDDNLSKEAKDKARNSFKNDVIKHINDISSKYIIEGETTDMAYMFIPAEAIFSEIYGKYPEIVDKSYEKKVYIVSPTTLMAYITAIKSIYLSQRKEKKAKEIEQLLYELNVEFLRLKERQENLQRDFEKIIPDFEKVAISANKIIKKFAAINTGEIDE